MTLGFVKDSFIVPTLFENVAHCFVCFYHILLKKKVFFEIAFHRKCKFQIRYISQFLFSLIILRQGLFKKNMISFTFNFILLVCFWTCLFLCPCSLHSHPRLAGVRMLVGQVGPVLETLLSVEMNCERLSVFEVLIPKLMPNLWIS